MLELLWDNVLMKNMYLFQSIAYLLVFTIFT